MANYLALPLSACTTIAPRDFESSASTAVTAAGARHPVVDTKHSRRHMLQWCHSCSDAESRPSLLQVTYPSQQSWSCITLVAHQYFSTDLNAEQSPRWCLDWCRIDDVDLWCLTMMFGIKWHQFVRSDEIGGITKQPNFTAIIQSRRHSVLWRIARMDDDADAKMMLTAPPADTWKRPPGRPRITWLNVIQCDLRACNLTVSLNEAVDLAQNHPVWRLMSAYGTTHSRLCMREKKKCSALCFRPHRINAACCDTCHTFHGLYVSMFVSLLCILCKKWMNWSRCHSGGRLL